MSISHHHAPRSVAALVLVTASAAACGGSGSGNVSTQSTPAASTAGAASAPLLRGTVASATPGTLVINTATGPATVKLTQPFQVYDREPATLADVKDSSFVGVTTVKQPDGSEQAREIHIFPEALRGLGEGSRMMTQNAGGSRMTNGAVSGSRMTNGAASPARMSNGNVASANGSSLVVRYAGGSIEIAVPPGTPVTELKATSKPLAPGDPIVVPATKGADGSLSSNKVLLNRK